MLRFALFHLAWPLLACSSFMMDGPESSLMGKNYDWHLDQAHLITNKRHVSKVAAVLKPGQVPARWTSEYASLTFNQYGREFPNGGMNEKGLAVEILWLSGSQYEAPDSRPTINELNWVQYQLDRYATTEDVLAHLPEIRLVPVYAETHFLVCDATRSCATVEWVKGKVVTHAGADLSAKAITNSTYQASKTFLKNFEGFGGGAPAPQSSASLDRFVRAAMGLLTPGVVARAFEVLDSVRQSGYTVWSIVYDLKSLEVNYRTRKADHLRQVDIKAFDPSCKAVVKVLPIDEGEGDVAGRFRDYSAEENRKLVKLNMPGELPTAALDMIANYPDKTVCTE